MPSPVTPARRRRSLVWRFGALTVVALLLTAAVVEGRRPPSVVAGPVAQAVAELRALPGVAHAAARLTRPGEGPRHDELAPDGIDEEAPRVAGAWLATLTVEPSSTLTTPEAVALAERVDAVRERAAARAPADTIAWDVWLRDDARAHATEVRLTGTTDVEAAVRGARTLAGRDGVRRVRVAEEHADVVVVRVAHATTLASAAAREGLELVRVTTGDARGDVRVVFPQVALAGAFVELASAAELVPSVTRVTLADQGDLLGASLSVEVADDSAIDRVDRWLRAPDRVLAPGRTVSYDLRSPGRTSSGYVGGVEPERPAEPVPVEPSVPDDPTGGTSAAPGPSSYPDDPGAPACTGADLDVRIGGMDAAMGARFLELVATNVSGRPCAVEGMPALGFRGRSGDPVQDVTFVPRADAVTGVRRVVVPPGAEVSAGIEWGMTSIGAHRDPAAHVLVTAVPGGEVVDLPVTGPGGTADWLDLVDGAVVDVWPWDVGPGMWG
jgi:hypothetical protein